MSPVEVAMALMDVYRLCDGMDFDTARDVLDGIELGVRMPPILPRSVLGALAAEHIVTVLGAPMAEVMAVIAEETQA